MKLLSLLLFKISLDNTNIGIADESENGSSYTVKNSGKISSKLLALTTFSLCIVPNIFE